ncbi:MAG: hexose kinase [Methylomarinum sp.]|nr:hexose kinase [Methylomarinum sp.]
MNISTTPIVSLSLNPAIDLTYEIHSLQNDQKSRATNTRYDPGGTGINVGRALEKLKANSHTCCITAGKMGEFLNALLKQELNNLHTQQVDGETRINTTILQHQPRSQYEINATGPSISPLQLDKIVSRFLMLCNQGIGILTGSLPPGAPENTYQTINTALKKQGARAIIDAPIPVLKMALNSKPFLIKPNLHELQTLSKKNPTSIDQIAAEARSIAQQGTSYICVSLGQLGAILTTPDNSYYCNSPTIKTHSTVGAGDAMVAGLAHAFAQNLNPKQALKLAVACGSGTAKQPGTQLFNPEEINQLSKQLNVKTLDI